jgi:carbamoyl-phosphate synthase large subunit
VLEVNPRASRTVPFVAKTIGRPLAAIAAKIMAGETLAEFDLQDRPYDHIAVKEAVFPFARFAGVDTCWAPKCARPARSWAWTGSREGEGLAPAFARAFAKAQLGGGTVLPEGLRLRLGEGRRQAVDRRARPPGRRGFKLILHRAAPAATCASRVSTVELVKKVLEGRPHIVDAMKNGGVQLVFNTTEGKQSLLDSFEIRRSALMMKIPYFTTSAGALAAAQAIAATAEGPLESASPAKLRTPSRSASLSGGAASAGSVPGAAGGCSGFMGALPNSRDAARRHMRAAKT